MLPAIEYSIRRAVRADFTAVQSLVFGTHERVLAAAGHDVSGRLPFIFPSLANAEEFSKPAALFWIAEPRSLGSARGVGGASILGAISVITSGDDTTTVEINAFYVLESLRGRGIGASLMDTALAYCRESGVHRVELTSNKGFYDAAIRYYEKRGFKNVKEYEVAPGITLVDLLLEL
jgi:GNAT superfamily N-acetyltransferase